MHRWTKILFIGLLVAFAAGSVVQVTQATVMDAQMSMSGDDSDGGCDDCPFGTEGGAMACSSGCAVSASGLTGVFVAPFALPYPMAAAPRLLQSMADWRAPPEPFPPKPLV